MLPLTLALLDGPDVLLVVGIFVLLFGASKIPEIARSLGRAKGEFEKGAREGREMLSKEPADAQADDAKLLKAARELGIPTEGRSISDVKKDVRAKMS